MANSTSLDDVHTFKPIYKVKVKFVSNSELDAAQRTLDTFTETIGPICMTITIAQLNQFMLNKEFDVIMIRRNRFTTMFQKAR